MRWVEESFTNFDKGINWRSYVVCDVAYSDVNNWLWTPFIERGPAQRIYIEIKFSMRDCALFPGTALSCKETFSLLYYEFDVATHEPPPWQPESYTLVDRIAADEGRFTQTGDVIINTEVRSIPVTKKGVYFAFRDQGACISLLAIRVFYIACPEIVAGLARFPETLTGPDLTSIETAAGQCAAHAQNSGPEPPHYLCKADGTWYFLTGECLCQPGYEPDDTMQSCKDSWGEESMQMPPSIIILALSLSHSHETWCQCPPGRYQPQPGGKKGCLPCPPHSFAPHAGLSECRCDPGYFRAPQDPKETPCTRQSSFPFHSSRSHQERAPFKNYEFFSGPPSAPQNLTVNFVDQSTVILSWNPPYNTGGRTDIRYRMECDTCDESVTYLPAPAGRESFNETKVTISRLRPVTKYRFQVYSENGVSDQSDESNYVHITVTTEAQVSLMVSNVRVVDVKSTEIVLAWDAPNDPFTDIEMYEVRYFVKGQEGNASTVLTKKDENPFPNLEQRTEYGFQVRAKTDQGWGEFSTPAVYRMTGHVLAFVGDDENKEVHIIAGVTVAVVLLLLFLLLAAFFIIRSRGNEECRKKQPSDCDTLEYRNGEVLSRVDNPQIVTTHTTNMTTPLFTQVGPPRTYVDPHTYEDPNQAVKEFARREVSLPSLNANHQGKCKLPAPMDCPEALHQLMLDCWQKERTHRPTFGSIVQTLDRLIRCPDTLRKLTQNRPNQNPLAPDAPDLTRLSSVAEWLTSVKMSRYLENFERAGIDSLEHVARLTLQDLQVLGISLVGHQKKIMNSIQTMRAQMSLNISDGFLV
ncbi:unnamed protein product [Darwinula stevensoni]|uniref:Uncharacterized protein n=1 Tax=Darwinula stevensoni TaxID=69355 RepID=A0A7R8ZXR6_9CRUS|nr:unnamed protein product [Darwinula stevensoni]CAG0878978.1 unnamed protein product [Darwinula stevensoni]